MCGIVAAVSKRGGISADSIARATRSLRHRGPDAQQVWTSLDGRAALGHARLSIIDLETGDQPIPNEDGTLRVVVNGELYDFERIRCELEKDGHTFRTRSDSEIALHLFEDRGSRALASLRGEFALAIWDERDGQLFAARDRFGIKPLYYTVYDGTFYLASEVKALAEAGVPLRWDRDTLYDVHFVSHPPDRSLFAGIYQLPPASYLLTDGEQVRVMPYWDWDYPAADLTRSNGDGRQWVAQLEQSFEEAVRLRLRADVPVACYLSGGIDSCAVLGFASRLSSKPLRAYTLAFDHADYDESALAVEQAERSGAEFCRVDIHSEDLADHFSDAIYHAERPIANAHAIAKFLLSRAVRDSGIKVVLTGEGSDEIFAGYPHFRRDLILYGGNGHDPGAKARLLAELEAANRVSAGLLMPQGSTAFDSVKRVLGFVPSNLETWGQIGQGLLRVTSDEFRHEFATRDTFRVMLECLDVERQIAGRHPVNQALYIWGKTMLPNYILSNLGDRMEMAHSVEGRLPFLDHHVVEQAARMPVSMKIKGTIEKYVLREAARPVLIDAVYTRQKHPFMSPPATIQTSGRLYTFLQDTLRSDALDGPGIYDRARVLPLLDSIPSMDAAARGRTDALLMWMTSLCVLAERLRM
ncbi:MAG TPA: asparagine synthase (glutamine-hydrolyzing) [Vicinamibacterales bacterium]|nr:asparagine synthase (glutamine-hydrolyzing) [Vicinamibacterales bacterium]